MSDGVLALATLISSAMILRAPASPVIRLGGASLLFLGFAALVGTLRFAGVDAVVPIHHSMAWTSRMIALPAFATSVLLTAFGQAKRPLWYGGAAIFSMLAFVKATPKILPGLAAVAMLLISAGAVFKRDKKAALLAASGGVIYVVAGLFVGTEGRLGPILRVDLFHYLLAIAHPALAISLIRIGRS